MKTFFTFLKPHSNEGGELPSDYEVLLRRYRCDMTHLPREGELVFISVIDPNGYQKLNMGGTCKYVRYKIEEATTKDREVTVQKVEALVVVVVE